MCLVYNIFLHRQTHKIHCRFSRFKLKTLIHCKTVLTTILLWFWFLFHPPQECWNISIILQIFFIFFVFREPFLETFGSPRRRTKMHAVCFSRSGCKRWCFSENVRILFGNLSAFRDHWEKRVEERERKEAREGSGEGGKNIFLVALVGSKQKSVAPQVPRVPSKNNWYVFPRCSHPVTPSTPLFSLFSLIFLILTTDWDVNSVSLSLFFSSRCVSPMVCSRNRVNPQAAENS